LTAAAPSFDVTSKQTRALKSAATEILYGGAAGGGTSFFHRVLACILCALAPGLQVHFLELALAAVAMAALIVVGNRKRVERQADSRCRDGSDGFSWRTSLLH
jgi:hypothetical protein